jgi:aminoglycoside 3-N-acetyltransferase
MNKEGIREGLQRIGLKRGDTVILHSALSSLGHVEGGADAVVDAFLETLGSEGTLIVPTFGALGVITDAVKGHPDAVSSIHPMASIAAIGAKAEEICRDHWKAETAHADNTPYVRIAEMGGYVCLLGVDQDRNTTLHTVEELLGLPYLKPTSEKTFDTPEGKQTKSWTLFPGPHRDFIGLDAALRASGKMTIGKIGTSAVRLIRSRDLIDICMEIGRRDPAFMLCANPNCADCVMQRADLYRARMAGEAFTLAAAGSLAGRYVPEMLENLNAAGIGAVELDAVQGKPVHQLRPDVLKTSIAELKAGGLDVSLRLAAFEGPTVEGMQKAKGSVWATDAIFGIAATEGAGRIALPLTSEAEEAARLSAEYSVPVAFYNCALSGESVSRRLMELKEKNLPSGFVFNGAEFARCGESPFLGTYKLKLRRFVEQLDVEDGLWDGTPVPLAQGNAEVKEMVSILRCSNFEGMMVLGARNRAAGDLRQAAQAFARLLDTM